MHDIQTTLVDVVRSATLRKATAATAAGTMGMIGAVVSLAYWIEAEWFHDPGPYVLPPDQSGSWAGYTKQDFVALVGFISLTSMSYSLMWVGITTGVRVSRQGTSTVIEAIWVGLQSALGVGSITAGLMGAIVWGGESFMNCAALFCINPEKYPVITWPHRVRDLAGLGWMGSTGMMACLSLVPLGCILLYRVARHAWQPTFPLADVQPHDAAAIDRHSKSHRRWLLINLLLAQLLIVFFAVITFYLPDTFEYMTDSWIALYGAAVNVVDPSDTASRKYDLMMQDGRAVPELPWAFFFTYQIRIIKDQLYLKLWPANVMYFCYLFGILTSSFIVTHTNRRWAAFWIKPMPKPRWTRHVAAINTKLPKALQLPSINLTRGEFAAMWITKWLIVVFFIYWVHDHNYNGYWSPAVGAGASDVQRWARSMGQLAVLFLSLLLFAGSRNNIMHKLMGTSWEVFIWVHKVLGYGMLFALACHIFLWWKHYSDIGTFPGDIFQIPIKDPQSTDNFTVPAATVTSIILFLSMGLLSLHVVRRKFFELFYYAHLFAAYTTIPVVLWHSSSGWEYLLPGVTVWFMDRLYRASRSAAHVKVLFARQTEDLGTVGARVVEIKFIVDSHPLASARPGQYVFVNVPEISLFEWHPFTLSRTMIADSDAVNDGLYLSLHIKAMGEGTWTERLFNLVKQLHDEQDHIPEGSISLAVDGPCGSPFNAEDYTDVILLGAGIGVTPVAAIFDHFKRVRRFAGRSVHEREPLVAAQKQPTRLRAIWAVREDGLVDTDLRLSLSPWLHEDHLEDDTEPLFEEQSTTVYFTQATGEAAVNSEALSKRLSSRVGPIEAAVGRPNLPALLDLHVCERLNGESQSQTDSADEELTIRSGTSPIVFVCGPAPFVETVEEWCTKRRVPYHLESFEL